jgi:hypothetical protein
MPQLSRHRFNFSGKGQDLPSGSETTAEVVPELIDIFRTR